VVWLLPLGYLALLSVADHWPTHAFLPRSWTLERWRMHSEPGLWRTALHSLWLALFVATASTATAFFVSRAIAESRWRGLWLGMAHLAFGFSPVILGACLAWFVIRIGWSGRFAGVAWAQVSVAHAFAVVVLQGLWTPDRRALVDTARTLGARPEHVWWWVLWPTCRPLVLVCWAQTFFYSWMQYGLTLTLGAGKVQTLPLQVYDYVFEADPGYAAVAALVLIVPPFLLLLVDHGRGPVAWLRRGPNGPHAGVAG
jgi:putative spermidine/putrescine transport system permease protein